MPFSAAKSCKVFGSLPHSPLIPHPKISSFFLTKYYTQHFSVCCVLLLTFARMWINKLGAVIFLVFYSFISYNQTLVQGQVVDDQGMGIPGVLVEAKQTQLKTRTNNDGFFKLELEPNRGYTIVVSYQRESKNFQVNLKNGEQRNLGKILIDAVLEKGEVEVTQNRSEDMSFQRMPPIDFQNFALPNGVTQALAYITPAVSNNELSTNYNVRGGNYDENLIYVNGFEIYRPFLTRAGQQEGMGFIHSALVESISFSAGGFEARYNDRLSSVLDIQYKTPDTLRASLVAGLLGVEAHMEQKVNRFSYLAGTRFRSNGYLLNTLPAQGEYNPVFWDFQFLSSYDITDNLKWNLLGHYSYNAFNFVPQSRETTFGTFNQALSFRVFFQGQERSVFNSLTGGTSFVYTPDKKTELALYATVFNSDEQERFDVLGQYFLNELEMDPAQENFGDSVNSLGVGSFLNHSRNVLLANIVNVYHTGSRLLTEKKLDKTNSAFTSSSMLRWGANFQKDYFTDNISEWVMIDSAGFISPNNPGQPLELRDVIKQRHQVQNTKVSANVSYAQDWSFTKKQHAVRLKIKEKGEQKRFHLDTINNSQSRLSMTIGGRLAYTASNEEWFFTPRASLTFVPRMYYMKDDQVYRRNIRFRLATGLYYQPPMYRDMRQYFGTLNTEVLSQKSFHVVGGADVFFHLFEREKPFKFSAEGYYKYLWDVNPYKLSDIRLRYFGHNDAEAFAYGLDLNLHGQFIDGIESFFKVGLMRTMENLFYDDYYDYFNSDGDLIIPGFTFNNTPVDSTLQSPGWIPRPTDQLLNFGMLFQDKMPGFEQLSVQLSMFYGSRLPYGPPGEQRHADTLRQRAYYRVDLGISYDFFYGKTKEQRKGVWKNLSDCRLSLETFNMLGINNVLNQTWIQDTEGRQYAIPNYLTQRLFNLKFIVRM